jgi:membrane fusion protein (multidrug efflux system)
MSRSLLLPLAAAAAALSIGPRAASSAEPPPTSAVRVRLVKTDAANAAHWAAASLGAVHVATLSTRLAASVRAIRVEEGMRVRQGQLLVSLADDDVRAQLRAAETALESASAHERRIVQLAAQRAATQSELEMAQAQRAQAAAAVAAAKANLAYTEIRAPFAATVQARRVNAGDLVGPGQPLVELEGSDLEVQASLSEAEARGLRIGQRLRFQAGDRQGEAEITALSPGGDPLSHRRGLRARVASAGEGLRSGSFARIELPGAAPDREAAWVPRSALVERGDLIGVFVAEGGRAQLRWVSLGEPAGDRFPVRAGLKPGEPVVDSPGALRDGQVVEVSRGD